MSKKPEEIPPPAPPPASKGRATVVRPKPAAAGAVVDGRRRAKTEEEPPPPPRGALLIDRGKRTDGEPALELMLAIGRSTDGRFRVVLVEKDYSKPEVKPEAKTKGWGTLVEALQDISRAMPMMQDFVRKRLPGIKPVIGAGRGL